MATQPATLNRFAYVLNNPASAVDPTGLIDSATAAAKRHELVAKARDLREELLRKYHELYDELLQKLRQAQDAFREYVVPAATQCAVWAVQGFIAGGGWIGAAAGCGAAVGAYVARQIFGPNPFSDCISWAGAGLKTGGWPGAGILCVTGAAGYFAGDNAAAQCVVWMAGSARAALPADRAKAGYSGCFAGVFTIGK